MGETLVGSVNLAKGQRQVRVSIQVNNLLMIYFILFSLPESQGQGLCTPV